MLEMRVRKVFLTEIFGRLNASWQRSDSYCILSFHRGGLEIRNCPSIDREMTGLSKHASSEDQFKVDHSQAMDLKINITLSEDLLGNILTKNVRAQKFKH